MALTDYTIDTSGSPQDVQRRQAMAEALMKQGGDSTPAAGGANGGWITALNRGLAGALGGYQRGAAANEERQGRESARQQLANGLMGADGKINPQAYLAAASNPWVNPQQIGAVGKVADWQHQSEKDAEHKREFGVTSGFQANADRRAAAAEGRAASDFENTPDQFVSNPKFGQPGEPQFIDQYAAAKAAAEAGPGLTGPVTGPDGKPIAIPPGVDPATFRKAVTTDTAHGMAGKFTETQGKANQFATRMQHAESTLSKMDGEGASLKGAVLDKVPGGNYLQSNNYQDYKQAEQEFVTALLRRESGAAIAHHEFDSYGKQFFPRPGDGPEVIAQKRQARWNALNSMKSEAGPAYKEAKPLPTASASATAPEEKTVGGKTYVKNGSEWFEK